MQSKGQHKILMRAIATVERRREGPSAAVQRPLGPEMTVGCSLQARPPLAGVERSIGCGHDRHLNG
jgi:hypothetical protein